MPPKTKIVDSIRAYIHRVKLERRGTLTLSIPENSWADLMYELTSNPEAHGVTNMELCLFEPCICFEGAILYDVRYKDTVIEELQDYSSQGGCLCTKCVFTLVGDVIVAESGVPSVLLS